ncbi:sigma-70 family RNA polymerase sigma factor [Aeoliella sp. ICT_H6.2]|uniref:Sigma-70 family RNA polymerase sigma factor n=1 Tax=Aeoliella straminimaris TaxID=2954799 RepID=A0A9X2F5W3_9BACT|nr:sigma-70 family RNA polymerase sigma factor [Aeoliella straminimaris]MCO6042827.1 sigma-70 family RNA polymerase sigma factor [Aeoliella straminimaris]
MASDSNSNHRVGGCEGSADLEERFIQLLTDEQPKLLNYIAMLLGDPHSARNVLQDTNLVIWRKSADFEMGTSFSAWTRKIAFWQVQAYVRDQKRDRHVFSDELLAQLAGQEDEFVLDEEDTRRIALRHCLPQLSRSHLDLIRQRYEEDTPIAVLAKRSGKSAPAIRMGLMRLRRVLLRCIQKELGYQGPSIG